MSVLLVILGGAVGAPARYLLDVAVSSRTSGDFPWGTWVINVVGSFVLGLVAAAVGAGTAPEWLQTLVGTGFCGALTTFSTFSYETVALLERDRPTTAAAYAGSSLVVGLAACWLGWAVGARL